MLPINICCTKSDAFYFILFLSRSEPELRFFTALLALFGFLFSFLLTLLGLKHQSSGAALFHEHGTIMLLLTIDVCTCTIALAAAMLQTSNPRYIPFFKSVCLISGAFASDLLLLILFPPFGWFVFIIFVFILICLVYGSYEQILNCSQEFLGSISSCTSHCIHILCNWFQENFQFQTSNGSLNEIETQVAEMT